MRRREFIAGLGSLAVCPFEVHAQQMRVLGLLAVRSEQTDLSLMAEFRKGLGEAGFAESGNLRIEYRWADGHYDRLPALANDLVNRRVDVIVTTGGFQFGTGSQSCDGVGSHRLHCRR